MTPSMTLLTTGYPLRGTPTKEGEPLHHNSSTELFYAAEETPVSYHPDFLHSAPSPGTV